VIAGIFSEPHPFEDGAFFLLLAGLWFEAGWGLRPGPLFLGCFREGESRCGCADVVAAVWSIIFDKFDRRSREDWS